MGLSEQAAIFFTIMMVYIIYIGTPYTIKVFFDRLLAVIVITGCIQYLSMTNLHTISWVFVFIPIFYILTIIILKQLMANN